VEPRRFIRSGIAASALGHLSALTMVLIYGEWKVLDLSFTPQNFAGPF
jgi:hypothetical protein